MTADLSALVRVCVSVCARMCVTAVLCLKRMNHHLCRPDAGSIGGVMLERETQKLQTFINILTLINLSELMFLV